MVSIKKIWKSITGAGYIDKAIAIGVALLITAIVVPMGISQIMAENTSGWNPAVTTIFTVLLPVLAVLGIVLYFLPRR